MSINNRTWTIPASGVLIRSGLDITAPCTLYVTSVNVAKNIEVSADGVTFTVPENIVSAAGSMTAGIDFPFRTLRITATAGDQAGAL